MRQQFDPSLLRIQYQRLRHDTAIAHINLVDARLHLCVRQELVQPRRAEFRKPNTGDGALRVQCLEGPIGPCPFGDIALGRDVFVLCVERDVREGDDEEVEVGRSE